MILKIYSVYDSKAEAFLPPFFQATKAMAIRIFENVANDPKHQFGANPADYTLFEIGQFDDESAKIEAHKTPHNIGLAIEFKTLQEDTSTREMFPGNESFAAQGK